MSEWLIAAPGTRPGEPGWVRAAEGTTISWSVADPVARLRDGTPVAVMRDGVLVSDGGVALARVGWSRAVPGLAS